MEEELNERKIWRIVSNIETWRGRWGIYLFNLKAKYCGQCRRIKYCRRVYANEHIRRALWKGEDCPDLLSIWERVLDGGRESI